jgi:hypothetical protein
MAFQQLYYTSCERGLGGYGGYQFNAITPGVSPAIMREVEEKTVYEPPRWLQADPSPNEPEAYPVAFSHGVSEATRTTITAHVVFTGADYSGRPGNYFAHTLITSDPERDFGSLLPAELWGAEWWQSGPVDGTDLPELPGSPPRGVIDRPGVQAFLDARQAEGVLQELLTAVGLAMAGERPVLLASQDATENAWWIGAVSYLLGQQLGRRLTFTTYSYRPAYARYHLIGTLADALPPDAEASFLLFDLTSGQIPSGTVHPLAAMLAGTGVMAAPGLWQQAAVFASGTERDLDDWLAPVAVAAGVLGQRLSPGLADIIVCWLRDAAGWMPRQLADVVLGVVLAQRDQVLADERLVELLELARRWRVSSRVEHLERLLVDRAISHIDDGEPAKPIRLTGAAAEAARIRVAQVLEVARPAVALVALKWAAASEVELADAELERYGQAGVDAARPGPEVARLLREYPAVLRGYIARLAGEARSVTEAVLSGPIGAQLKRDDLAAYPELTEVWLLRSAAAGTVKPLRAFDEIVDVRAAAGRSPLVDTTLLNSLWPGACPAEHIAELLGSVTEQDSPDVLAWFQRQISAVSARGTLDAGWRQLARVLNYHPLLSLLTEKDSWKVRNTAHVTSLLRAARSGAVKGHGDALAELFSVYSLPDVSTRRLLDEELPEVLAEADPLGQVLGDCPPGVAMALGRTLASRLASLPPDIALAHRVFRALAHPDVIAQPALRQELSAAFEQVCRWRRRDVGVLARTMENDSRTAELFRKWRDEQRGGRTRRLFGGGSALPPGGHREEA